MKKTINIARMAMSAFAAMAFTVAVSSVSSCCHRWFAQPVEPEELRELVNNK